MPAPVGTTIAGRPLAYWPGNPLELLFEWDPSDPTGGHTWRVEAVRGDLAHPTSIWSASVVVAAQEITAAWTAAATSSWAPGTVWRLLRDNVTVLAGHLWRGEPQDDDDPLDAVLVVDLEGPPTLTVTVSAAGGVSLGVVEGLVDAEAVARAAADAAEVAARIAAVSAEAATRNSVDGALLTGLADEQAARIAGDALKVNSADLTNLLDTRFDQRRAEVVWKTTADFDLFDQVTQTTHSGIGFFDTAIETRGVASSGSGDGGLARRGRFDGRGVSPAGGNAREFRLFKNFTAKDAEIWALLSGHTGAGANNGQQGLVLRYDPATRKAIVVWHDIFVANPRVINVAPWQCESSPGAGDGSTNLAGGLNWSFRPVLDPPFRLPIVASSRVNGVAYYDMGRDDHGIIVGDTVHVIGCAPLVTFAPGTVSYVSGNIVGFPFAGDRNLGAGPGYLQMGGSQPPLPYWLGARTSGSIVQVCVHPFAMAHPGWSDPRYCATWDDATVGALEAPTGLGRWGIFNGHIVAGNYVAWGAITVETKDKAS